MGDPGAVSDSHEDFLKGLGLFDPEHVDYAEMKTEQSNLDPIEKEKLYNLEKMYYGNQTDPDGKTAKQILTALRKSIEINDHRLRFAFDQRKMILEKGYGEINFDPSISEYIPDEPSSMPGGRKRKTRRRRRSTRRRKTLAKKK